MSSNKKSNRIGLNPTSAALNLTEHPKDQNESICNENAQKREENSDDEIKDRPKHIPQRNGNTIERESTNYFPEIENSLYHNPLPIYNTKQRELGHRLKKKDINEIIKSVNDNLFRKMMLDRWIKLHEHAKKPVHTLKDHLSYYLGKLKSPYSVDGNLERGQVQSTNDTIHTTISIMEEYQNRLFFYYVIGDKLPH
ncbi:hypothetical protein C922_05575 [Plasmodium inui San Antonio 1]|uniref:Plasmodium RESA N-terminal domain-containing protein n=1 Tax=Plasmodium inui San Antonio 1 TaxID=1237626 RepID=W7A4N0_9APIC|nr:hypothetical protein C922_05575 [Plasmodium inui San Antonio 1]EUD64049.1 hypothetical protein C922_05575 [Plasmodium inui San Antonio 1]